MNASASTPFTYDDYARLRDDRRYEVIEGQLLLTPSPRTYHQKVTGNLFDVLLHHVRENRLGEVLIAPCDVVLSSTNVVQPDVLFVRRDRLAIIEEKYVSAAPDLVVEVLSPGTTLRDRRLKFRLYARFGVRELWIVDPIVRGIEVFGNSGKRLRLAASYGRDETLRSDVFPNLRVALADVF
jgi:Uma2 family endonuclease